MLDVVVGIGIAMFALVAIALSLVMRKASSGVGVLDKEARMPSRAFYVEGGTVFGEWAPPTALYFFTNGRPSIAGKETDNILATAKGLRIIIPPVSETYGLYDKVKEQFKIYANLDVRNGEFATPATGDAIAPIIDMDKMATWRGEMGRYYAIRDRSLQYMVDSMQRYITEWSIKGQARESFVGVGIVSRKTEVVQIPGKPKVDKKGQKVPTKPRVKHVPTWSLKVKPTPHIVYERGREAEIRQRDYLLTPTEARIYSKYIALPTWAYVEAFFPRLYNYLVTEVKAGREPDPLADGGSGGFCWADAVAMVTAKAMCFASSKEVDKGMKLTGQDLLDPWLNHMGHGMALAYKFIAPWGGISDNADYAQYPFLCLMETIFYTRAGWYMCDLDIYNTAKVSSWVARGEFPMVLDHAAPYPDLGGATEPWLPMAKNSELRYDEDLFFPCAVRPTGTNELRMVTKQKFLPFEKVEIAMNRGLNKLTREMGKEKWFRFLNRYDTERGQLKWGQETYQLWKIYCSKQQEEESDPFEWFIACLSGAEAVGKDAYPLSSNFQTPYIFGGLTKILDKHGYLVGQSAAISNIDTAGVQNAQPIGTVVREVQAVEKGNQPVVPGSKVPAQQITVVEASSPGTKTAGAGINPPPPPPPTNTETLIQGLGMAKQQPAKPGESNAGTGGSPGN